ncbi:hypothetical protein XarbCFBP7629_01680 [Xanthomonas arboricola]|nr:hypothetical protein XarbCFBP7629_01680 [Xanthomonas arboricola]
MNRESGIGNRESGIGNRESGIGNRKSVGAGFCWVNRWLTASRCGVFGDCCDAIARKKKRTACGALFRFRPGGWPTTLNLLV